MQRGRVLNLSFYSKIFQFVIKNKLLIIITAIFITGICFAVFTYGKYNAVEEWSQSYIQKFIVTRSGRGLFKIAVDSFLTSSLFIILCFIFGTSMLGVVLVPICVALRAFVYGSVISYLYSAYSLEGVAFHAIILLPAAIFLIIAFILASIEAIRFSLFLANLTLSRTETSNLFFEFRQYCLRFLIFSIFVLISCFLDAILSSNFLDNFQLI